MATNRIPYRSGLRVLGRLLNGDKARMVTVCEIEQGFLLHYFQRGEPGRVASRAIHGAEVLELDDVLHKQRGKPEPSGSFKALQSIFGFHQGEARRFQNSHPLCPMGYEEFLRALGDALDHRNAQAVLISELDDRVHVEYTVERADFVVRQGQRMALPGRRQESYTAPQIATLVRTCREQAVERVRRNGQQLAFNPMDIASYLDAAPILEDDGQYREAEDLYRKALDVVPNHPEVHYRLACHARLRGDRKAAHKHVERAIQHGGGEGRYFHLLGRLNIERNNFTGAAQALEQAITCDPGNKIYHFHLGQVYERLGRSKDARALLAYGRTRSDGGTAPGAVAEPSDGTRLPLDAAEQAATSPPTALEPAAEHEIPAAPAAPTPAVHPPDVAAGSGRSLAARVPEPAPAARVEEPELPALPAYPTMASPFDGAAEGWDSSATPALPAHVEAPPAGATPIVTTPLAEAGDNSLPTLGLTVADEWSAPSLPSLEVPADGAAAAAALPLAGVDLDVATQDETAAPGAWQAPDAIAPPADATEPAEPSHAAEAVQLAAAIMRAEELVRAEPHRADLHRKLGFLLAKQGRSEDAAAEFRRAVECGRRRVPS